MRGTELWVLAVAVVVVAGLEVVVLVAGEDRREERHLMCGLRKCGVTAVRVVRTRRHWGLCPQQRADLRGRAC